ncbi:MAG: hypothetical protein F6K00_14895 [Leptolyngbya sp. SIOISBB]|nr:hypothetical protein [Leptolyngbya sp. SIOISBB]
MTSPKITKLAETIRLATRTYDHGKKETALNLMGLVASKIHSLEERHELNQLVESTIRQSGAWVYYKSIVYGASSAIPKA